MLFINSVDVGLKLKAFIFSETENFNYILHAYLAFKSTLNY